MGANKDEERTVEGKTKFRNRLQPEHDLRCTCPQRKHVLKTFQIKYKAKVHTKFVAYFYSVKYYSSFVLFNNFYILSVI
jgi:hypothetical protein